MIKVDIIVKNWLDTSTSPSALGRFKNVEGQVKGDAIMADLFFKSSNLIFFISFKSPAVFKVLQYESV